MSAYISLGKTFYSWHHVMLLAFYAIANINLPILLYLLLIYKYASVWMCSKLDCAIYDYGLYTQLGYPWAWLILLGYMILLVSIATYICIRLQLYISRGTPNSLSLHLSHKYMRSRRRKTIFNGLKNFKKTFEHVKHLLITPPVICIPKTNDEFRFESDTIKIAAQFQLQKGKWVCTGYHLKKTPQAVQMELLN